MTRKRNPYKRKDYRKGGRVGYAIGGKPNRGDYDSGTEYRQDFNDWSRRNQEAEQLATVAPARTPTVAPVVAPTRTPVVAPVVAPTNNLPDDYYDDPNTFDKGESDINPNLNLSRVDSGEMAASGSIPRTDINRNINSGVKPNVDTNVEPVVDAAPITTPFTSTDAQAQYTGAAELLANQQNILRDPTKVDAGISSEAIQMGAVPQVQAATIGATTIDPTTGAVVSGVEAPQPMTTSTMTAAEIGQAAQAAGATGQVSDQALAQAAGVERVTPLEGEQVEIVPGALAQRVIGTLSPQAMAQAARVAGTTLSRVTRAKKQLANAGLSRTEINALGNDPEDLEDRLMDLTEAERGIIEGLPVEALVSNQLDSLLTGMESGDIPTWAGPAVSAVEQMLAQRGLTASTVGRDNLFNAIIQSAVPLAQANAQAIQQAVGQQKSIEAQAELQNAQMRQQTALSNADKVFNLNMAQFSSDQQTSLSNSQFLQTVSITNANNRQQAAIQNAVFASQANLAEADFIQRASINNAQAFLQTDLTNLSNQQQTNLVNAQAQQQVLLSNQASQNASRQFNATSENQTNQFMTGLITQVNQFNATQKATASQFNAQQANVRAAQQAGIDADINKTTAALLTEVDKFNATTEFQRDQWNAQNTQAIVQANVAWRRQANLADTAAINTVNQQNVQNAFNLNAQELAVQWQSVRDNATWAWQSSESKEDRLLNVLVQQMRNEADMTVEQLRASGQPGTVDKLLTFFGEAAIRSAFPTSTGTSTSQTVNVFGNDAEPT